MTTPFERIVRRFGQITSKKPEERKRSIPALELPTAHIRWGQPSDFSLEDIRNDGSGVTVSPPERPPLWGTYKEEGRKFNIFRVVNPEDETQFVLARQTTDLALHAVKENLNEEDRLEQYRLTLQNDYTPASPQPIYLKNTAGEDFDPVVLSPFESIIEVGWPMNDFVLISLVFHPRTQVFTSVVLETPPATEIEAPLNPWGILPEDNPATEENETELGKPPFPFMEQWQSGSVTNVDEDSPGYDVPLEPGSIEPLIVFTSSDSGGGGDKSKGNNLIALSVPRTLKDFTISYGPSEGGFCLDAPPTGTVVPRDDPHVIAAGGCYHGLLRGFVSSGEVIRPADEYRIMSSGADGEIVRPDPNLPPVFQWQLDRDNVHNLGVFSNSANDGNSVGGVVSAVDSFGAQYPIYYVYRKFNGLEDLKYDPKPFVFALYMVDVAFIKKFFRTTLIEMDQLPEIGIYAGEASEPEPEEGTFVTKGATIRWVWMKGNAREFAAELQDMNLTYAPGVDPDNADDDSPPPTEEQVWAALRDGTGYLDGAVTAKIQEGILNEFEDIFPSGASIEGPVGRKQLYIVDSVLKELTLEGDGG